MNRLFLYVAAISSFSTPIYLMNGSSIATLELKALEEQEAQADICSTCRESLGPVLEVLVNEHNQYVKLSPEVLKATPEERKASLLKLSADPAMPEAQKRLIQNAILQEQELFDIVTVKYTAAQARLKKIKKFVLSAESLGCVQELLTKEIEIASDMYNSLHTRDQERMSLNDQIAILESMKSDFIKLSELMTSIRSASMQEDITEPLEHEMLKLPSLEAQYNKMIDGMLTKALLEEAQETHLHCTHRFHKDCLDSHFKSQSITLPVVRMICPTCRAALDRRDQLQISMELTHDDYVGLINNKLCELFSMEDFRTQITRFLADPGLALELENMLGLSRVEAEHIVAKLKDLVASFTPNNLGEKGFLRLIQETFPSYSKEQLVCDINHLAASFTLISALIIRREDEWSRDNEVIPVLKSLLDLLLAIPQSQLPANYRIVTIVNALLLSWSHQADPDSARFLKMLEKIMPKSQWSHVGQAFLQRIGNPSVLAQYLWRNGHLKLLRRTDALVGLLCIGLVTIPVWSLMNALVRHFT